MITFFLFILISTFLANIKLFKSIGLNILDTDSIFKSLFFLEHTCLLKYCADIKEMHTNYPHEDIIRAIEFVVHRCAAVSKRGRRNSVCIERRPHGSISFGRSDPNLMKQLLTQNLNWVTYIAAWKKYVNHVTSQKLLPIVTAFVMQVQIPGPIRTFILLKIYLKWKFQKGQNTLD